VEGPAVEVKVDGPVFKVDTPSSPVIVEWGANLLKEEKEWDPYLVVRPPWPDIEPKEDELAERERKHRHEQLTSYDQSNLGFSRSASRTALPLELVLHMCLDKFLKAGSRLTFEWSVVPGCHDFCVSGM
jgi:hypothetical protein